MRLSEFILKNMQAILASWEAFAATRLPAAKHMDSLALRDHARQILEAIAKDLTTAQTTSEQSEKSLGRAIVLSDAPQTAAEAHAVLRAQSGFDVIQLVSEYRALRASVLSLWTHGYQPDVTHFEDLIRFNEAIDQAVAESIKSFHVKVEESRNLLLGMLGHDMRSPLQTIQMTASYLTTLNADKKVSEAAARLIRSGARMKALLDDLLDFNRASLGVGIPVTPSNVNLPSLFADEVDRLRVANPGRKIELTVVGESRGEWDGPRLQQVLANLVSNALKYGSFDSPIRVALTGNDTEVAFDVSNSGTAIEPSTLALIFEPLKRGVQDRNRYESDDSLGLGLYISREIAKSHGGNISARSDQTETVFTVRLPRRH